MISPFVEQLKEVGIAQFANLASWKPQIGDFVIFNGWWKHWFGIVMSIEPGSVEIIKSVLPLDVFTMGPNEQKKEKNRVKQDISKFHNSKPGEYAIFQVTGGQAPVFYIR